MLSILLLGSPSIQIDGNELPLVRAQVRGLLFVLAAEQQPVPRARLCDLLWDTQSEQIGRRNLSHLLTHLRRALPISAVIQSDNVQVGLNRDLVWTDTQALACATQDTGTTMASLASAVALYRGVFLDGFELRTSGSFDQWRLNQQQQWERAYLHGLTTLLDHARSRGNYAQAIAYATQFLTTDSLAEEIHRQLMELLALNGERQAALRQFEQCAAALDEELGVDPMPQTIAIYEAIRSGQLQPSHSPEAGRIHWDEPSAEALFVGRASDLNKLHQQFDACTRNSGRIVLISGEAGVGKSSLLTQFAAQIAGQAQILRGQGCVCRTLGAFQPIFQALRHERQQLLSDPKVIEWLTSAEAAPALLNAEPALAPRRFIATHYAPTHEQIQTSLTQFLHLLAGRGQPVVLLLDDLHRSDSATRDWLIHLGRRLSQTPILIIGSYCCTRPRSLQPLYETLLPLGVVTDFTLAALNEIETAALCAAHNVHPSPTAVRHLHCLSAGNPQLLLALLTMVREEPDPDSAVQAIAQNPPTTVCEMLLIRTQSLPPLAKQLIEAAAVLPTPFTLDMLCQVSGRFDLDLVDALDDLLARELLVETNANGYCFKHTLTPLCLKKTMSHARRSLLEERIRSLSFVASL